MADTKFDPDKFLAETGGFDPSKFLKATIELWSGTTMYRHGAIFHLALQHLGQNSHQNLTVQQSQKFYHPRG